MNERLQTGQGTGGRRVNHRHAFAIPATAGQLSALTGEICCPIRRRLRGDSPHNHRSAQVYAPDC
jgi:hypothetical protein